MWRSWQSGRFQHPTPEIHFVNPNIGNKITIRQLQFRKDENKEKESGIGPFMNVGSQFLDIFKSPTKILRYGGEQLDACTDWTALKKS